MRQKDLLFALTVFGVGLWQVAPQFFYHPEPKAPEVTKDTLTGPIDVLAKPAQNTFNKIQGPAPKAHELREWIQNETLQIGRTDLNPANTRNELIKKAQNLSDAELNELKGLSLDEKQPGDTKFLSVYLIGLSESETATSLLMQIGQAPLTSTPNERQASDSTVVRLYALDALAKRLSATETSKYLKSLLLAAVAPPVAKHAEHLLSHL